METCKILTHLADHEVLGITSSVRDLKRSTSAGGAGAGGGYLQIHLSDGLREEAMNVILCGVRDWKSCGEDWT